jgi:hypothetical protein
VLLWLLRRNAKTADKVGAVELLERFFKSGDLTVRFAAVSGLQINDCQVHATCEYADAANLDLRTFWHCMPHLTDRRQAGH